MVGANAALGTSAASFSATSSVAVAGAAAGAAATGRRESGVRSPCVASSSSSLSLGVRCRAVSVRRPGLDASRSLRSSLLASGSSGVGFSRNEFFAVRIFGCWSQGFVVIYLFSYFWVGFGSGFLECLFVSLVWVGIGIERI